MRNATEARLPKMRAPPQAFTMTLLGLMPLILRQFPASSADDQWQSHWLNAVPKYRRRWVRRVLRRIKAHGPNGLAE